MKISFSIAPYTKAQYKKYAINLVALLFVFIIGYFVYAIYQSKHNHDGDRFGLVNLISGNKSKVEKLKNSSDATQTANLNTQYNTKGAAVKPGVVAENSQRAVALGFYEEYLNNKQTGQDQSATLAKYGTANLAAQYTNASNDPLLCGSAVKPTSVVITSDASSDGKYYFNLDFSDAKDAVASSQAIVVNVNGKLLVDGVACMGPI